jgi:hypothetical protein
LSEIKVGASYHITKEELFETPKEDILKHITTSLSRELSHHILNKTGIFETKEVTDGLQIRAECYVLTPNDFSKLVEKIQQDLMSFGSTSMIGGVS